MASYEAEITAVKSFIVQALGQLAKASIARPGASLAYHLFTKLCIKTTKLKVENSAQTTLWLSVIKTHLHVLFIQSYSTLS
jgi:hypothetical protein